jgi:2',3'-cyclic-nucleotide 2'-phosphodiesterase (5'-nucleotidase family)
MNARIDVMVVALVAAALAWHGPMALAANGRTTTVLTTEGCDVEECTFGDLATDALLAVSGTRVALIPAISFAPGQIPVGRVTRAAVAGMLTMPDEGWAVLELTGGQLRAALEQSVSGLPARRPSFLQVAGLTVVYNPAAPRNHRVVSAQLGFAPLDDTHRYEVGMPNSLAAGGSGYFTAWGDAPRVRSGNLGLADAIQTYVEARGTVSYTGQGRLVVGS